MFDLKRLVAALLRPRMTGMTELQTATQMMADLGRDDMPGAQQAFIESFKQLNADSKLSPKERCKRVFYLDEKAQLILNGMVSDVLRRMGRERQRAAHYAVKILPYWEEQTNGYRILLRGLQKSRVKALDPELPLIVARTLAGFSEIGKWSLLQYQTIDNRVWRNLMRLYGFADQQGFALTPLTLYPGQTRTTTCQIEFLRLNLLYLAQPESLTEKQIDGLDAWLSHHLHNLQLETEYKPHRQNFAVHLETQHGASRLRRNMVGSAYRYLNTQNLLQRLTDTIDGLELGDVPAEWGLPESFNRSEDLSALLRARARWSRDQYPARQNQRMVSNQAVTTFFGLDSIINALRSNQRAKLNPDMPSESFAPLDGNTGTGTISGHWRIEDESVQGVGVITDQKTSSNWHVDEIIGLQQADRFTLGVVRRIQQGDKIKLGIEVLAGQPRVVELGEQAGGTTHGIYLPEATETGRSRTLLLPANWFEPERALTLSAGSQKYRIRLMSRLSGDNWHACAGFTVTGRGS